ncbi:MAG: SIS domain-containing protein [Myxococcota bacterium]|nr:SIS domain-containing protein [Myxococcota bacterium]
MSEYGYADYLREAHEMIDGVEAAQVTSVCDAIETACRKGHTLFVCGNGGSAANASHFAEDMATLMLDAEAGTRLKTVGLTDAGPFILAVANDLGYDQIFERQLMVHASPGDVLLSISGSGNSPNVLRATKWARANGMSTLGVTGYDGGELGRAVDQELRVASFNMGMLECVHLLLLDFIVKELRFRVRGIAHPDR